MTLQTIIDQFDLLMDAPDSVSKLRQFILQLAVQGKLTERDPSDEPAEELLARIQAEKQRLYAAGEIRKPKTFESPRPEDVPFSLPAGWTWTRLGIPFNIVRGITFKKADKKREPEEGAIACLRTANIQEEVEWGDLIYVDSEKVNRNEQWVRKGDTIISMSNSYELVGKVAYVKEVPLKSSFGGFLGAVRPYHGVDFKYLYLSLNSPLLQDSMRGTSNQTTNIANLSLKNITPLPYPLPPLEEQHRIVATVDRLMEACDTLEAQQEAAARVRVRCTEAATQALQTADTPAAVRTAWHRLRDHLATLTATPDAVDAVRQTILQLAVQGKLTEQDPSDEPAEVLLERIQAEKQRLYEAGEIRKSQTAIPTIADGSTQLPEGWIWIELERAGVVNPRHDADEELPASFVPMRLIEDETGDGHDAEVRPWGEIKSGYTHFKEGDVGLAKITPCFQNRKSTVFRNLKNGIGAGTTELYIFRPLADTILPEYVLAFFQSAGFIEEGVNRMTGTAGQQRVPRDYVEQSLLPLPPLEEQHRIVATVDRLMDECDVLEAQLEREQTLGEELLEAVLHGAAQGKKQPALQEAMTVG